MSSLDSLVHEFRETNARLGFWLDSLSRRGAEPTPPPSTTTPQQMTGLLTELMRAGQWLRGLPNDRGPELDRELDAYRRNVERLRELLPSIHCTLLQERARLEAERGRVEAAAEWARRSSQTL